MNGDSNGNGKKFDWRVVLISAAMVLGQGLVQYGITTATMADHARRLDLIERRQEENVISRTEYDRRHSDLQEEIKELRQRVFEMEKKMR